jgi:hypothetical protein
VNTIAKWAAVFAMLACPIAALAQAVTYDFTGTIITGPTANSYATAPSGIYAGDTGTVSGTYTFDLAYNNPALVPGTFGMAGGDALNATGTNPNLPQPQTAPGNVFSTTLVGTSAGDAGLSYTTAAPQGQYSSISGVQATLSFGVEYYGNPQYIASESNYANSLIGTDSALSIAGPSCDCPNPPVGFTSAGLPVIVSGLTYTGSVATSVNDMPNSLYFDVTSLTPATTSAPEIDPETAGSALTLLAGFAALMRGRRRVAV